MSPGRLFALAAGAWLAVTLFGCGVADMFDEESAREATPDEIAAAVLASKPATTDEAIERGVLCPGSFWTFKNNVARSSKNPGDGYQWHHIVNQNPANKKRFGTRLHCTDNLISLPEATHQTISGFYNKKLEWTNGRFVRDVIADRSWRKQYEYGLEVLRDHGVKP